MKDFFSKTLYFILNSVEYCHCWVMSKFPAIWYIVLLIETFLYCKNNWAEVIKFNPFNGNSLLFILMLFLCLLPLIKDFSFSGASANTLDIFEIEKARKRLKDLEKKTNTNSDKTKYEEDQVNIVNEIENLEKEKVNV